MLTQVKAEIEVNGTVRLLEPLKIKRKSRAIVTVLDDDTAEGFEPTDDESTRAEERFARHIGSVSSGNPRSADNEQIDADLAREYSNSHDDEQ
jgi:hypothetical protein